MKTLFKKRCFIILVISIYIISCGKESVIKVTNSEPPVNTSQYTELQLSQEDKGLIEADNQFAIHLFKEVIKVETDKNVFISPLSIAIALTMTYNGADYATKDSMQAALQLSGMEINDVNNSYKDLISKLVTLDTKTKLLIANSIWYKKGFVVKNEFLDVNNHFFNAEITSLDFTDPNAKDVINSWVKDNTNNLITKIIESIPQEMIMYLINAIYFKGEWTYQFDKNKTYTTDFTLPGDVLKSCKMMISDEDKHQYFENDDFQAVNLTYGGGNFSMVILLPKDQKKADDVLNILDINNWDNWMSSFNEQEIDLYLPKFKLEYEIKLNDILKAMGMDIAFSEDKADFSGISDGPGNLYISEVKHKTFVEVNEEGTEAAAVTSVGIGLTSMPPTMYINKPFLFVIRENSSGTIIFMGKIVEPLL